MRTSRATIALVAIAALAGCKREWIGIPAPPTQLVVHGVLNRVDTMQIVLVERTLNGSVTTPLVTPFMPSVEPIFSDGGVAERNVSGYITAPDGTQYPAYEMSSCYTCPSNRCVSEGPPCNGSGGGMYKFFLRGASVVPGAVYKLNLTTTAGDVITAETTFPQATVAPPPTLMTFNRSKDTIALSWASAASAPAYQVRVDNPTLAWTAFTDSGRVSLTGELRNPEDRRLGRVFIPGRRQLMTVTAIDANLYDYYRTTNNSFVGYGSVTRVQGAAGVFGSAVLMQQRNVDVTATQSLPIEGTWDAVDAGLGYIYFTPHLNLYVESAASSKNDADAITGQYYTTTWFPAQTVDGSFKDGRLDITFGGVTFPERLVAEVRGDTIVGTYSKGAKARFVKRK